VLFLSAWANFIEWCTASYAFQHPQSLFITIKSWFYVDGTLKNDKVFVFYNPRESLFGIWLLGVPIFEGLKSFYLFYQHGPTLLSGVLLVMHFSSLKVDFIRLKAWFYVNGTLKYDIVFVFYSLKEFFF